MRILGQEGGSPGYSCIVNSGMPDPRMKYSSVPLLIAENAGATSTSPDLISGTGTSRRTARPPWAKTRFTDGSSDAGEPRRHGRHHRSGAQGALVVRDAAS